MPSIMEHVSLSALCLSPAFSSPRTALRSGARNTPGLVRCDPPLTHPSDSDSAMVQIIDSSEIDKAFTLNF